MAVVEVRFRSVVLHVVSIQCNIEQAFGCDVVLHFISFRNAMQYNTRNAAIQYEKHIELDTRNLGVV